MNARNANPDAMAAFSAATGYALAELAEETKLEIRRNCMPQVDALLMADGGGNCQKS